MMHRINHIHPTDNRLFLIIMLIAIISPVSADEALGSTIDCSSVEINYIDNPEWTHKERLEGMDKAFFESVNRFELCNLSNQSSSSSASASSSVSANGTNQASNTGSEAGLDSAASPEMTGTETASTSSPVEPNTSDGDNTADNNTNDGSINVKGGSSSNGVRPEDIPAADNDDAIAAQIRLAAEIEKDPVKKEKLWNEYRKYKGLPVK
jgi:hypothetical protein